MYIISVHQPLDTDSAMPCRKISFSSEAADALFEQGRIRVNRGVFYRLSPIVLARTLLSTQSSLKNSECVHNRLIPFSKSIKRPCFEWSS